MNIRRWSAAATVVVCVGLASLAVAWACTTNADMTLANSGSTSWDPNSSGQNFSECPLSEFGSSTHCKRDVDVAGTDFLNGGTTSVGTVDLYWVDEPFFTFTAGTQGVGQQVAADVCTTKGVLLRTGVSVDSAGAFSTGTTPVQVPPTASTTVDGTPRANAYYGANAVCAVWTHGGHNSGFGNQYNITT